MTIQAGQTALASDINDAFDDVYDAIDTKPQFSTQTDVTGSRANNTVYQNTSGLSMMVVVYIGLSTNQSASAQSDGSSPPTTTVAGTGINGYGLASTISFIVLAGNYYKVVWSPTATVVSWIEYTG